VPFVRPDAESAARALTSSVKTPRPTFPLILVSVTVAAVAMHIDAVGKYSMEAFGAGVIATAVLAAIVGLTVSAARGWKRTLAATLLPTIGGAVVGVLVQYLVLDAVVSKEMDPVRDLGGLVDTMSPVGWLLGGVVLGAAPALLVSVFLLLAARAVKKIAGHDAQECFGVMFVGLAGVLGAFALLVVDSFEAAPLLFTTGAAFVSLVVALLVDGARLRFLRAAWSGADGAFEVMPATAFAADASLAPLVAQAGSGNVLVKVDRKPDYRGAAVQPIALVGDTETDTVRPLVRRRAAAAAMLVAMSALATLALFAYGG
jgi:hypothetical protein